jgi:8-hydroxy-5-deazaflavin:NADPH oxidoreductase
VRVCWPGLFERHSVPLKGSIHARLRFSSLSCVVLRVALIVSARSAMSPIFEHSQTTRTSNGKEESMTTVTIFESGNMGSAIDSVLTASGASVDHIGSADPPGSVNGDIVILAVYYPALKDIIGKYADRLAGKIVVDITNPMNLETFDSLIVPADSSSAAELATALPSSRVLKAFNTNFAGTLNAKKVGPMTTTVLVAGDDAGAKTSLIDAVQPGGVEAIDVGGLNRARELEAMGFLQIKLAIGEQIGPASGFAVVR